MSLDKPELMFVHIGLRDTLRATARDQAGIEMPDVQFTWTSSDAGVVTVDAAGVVTSLGPGTAQVSASAAGRSAAVPATVQITSSDFTLCSGGMPTVVLLVEAQLRASLAADVARFADDLCVDGYRVWMAEFVPPNPSAIRAYLADAWTRSERTLQGAMLIGRIPHAYQYVVGHSANPAFPDVREEVISFQYYADVNGDFTVSPGYNGAHPYSYDEHGGDMNWELWIGVLPVYKGSTPATIDAMQRYFAKNHAYRTGGPKPPRAYLEINELLSATTAAEHDALMAALRDGQYSWTPFSNSPSAALYFNSVSTGLTVQQGYSALASGVADFTVVGSHGFWGAGGLLTIPDVETTPIGTTFYWSSGCAIGDLDHADNFLTSIVYSPTSTVLVAKGTTNNSGGMGNNENGFYGHNVAEALTAGMTFGSAVVGHVNAPLVGPWSASREFHFGTAVVVGDPTLRLRP